MTSSLHDHVNLEKFTQLAITCSKLTIETLEQGGTSLCDY